MIKAMRKWKIRTQLLVVIILGGVLAIWLFGFLWYHEPDVWIFCQRFPSLSWNSEAFKEKLREKAQETIIPEDDSLDEEEIQLAMKDFFDLRDEYTSVYLYHADDPEDSVYRTFLAGAYAPMMDNIAERSILDIGYQVTGGRGEMYFSDVMQFANKKAEVMIYSFHRYKVAYPYFLISFVLSVLTFLFCVLGFISWKMRDIRILKDAILVMAEGDLQKEIPAFGEDEIGILAHELDHLRIALDSNIRQEEQSRKANQDLITAISHDLRTPLTILNGYLEILQLGRTDLQADYLQRCLHKVADIKEMTDKMFEYALVFKDSEKLCLQPLPLQWIEQNLNENCDFIRLAGFQVQLNCHIQQGNLLADAVILKRVFNNLFSNILKYGDKKQQVVITCLVEKQKLKIIFFNTIKEEHSGTESNRIGLRSVEKMIAMHYGQLYVLAEQNTFMVEIQLPLL